ncbi:dihydrofolate reductase family protein [Agrococcus sp. Marseille-P2731]|uniref:dihydrofolate reductase family protein n=1 Tax=Agrococcus sp. Marseille-P2731 TaxID=1841862 RepID=UPI0009307EE9|nr:dihydrofolate reductase family protein [Agrococcus sp. Marseille-P2731]
MGELHVNMHVTLDGVITANGGPTEVDGDFPYAGWEWPYGDEEHGARLLEIVEGSDALLLGRVTYDIFRAYWPGKTDRIGTLFERVPKYVASRGEPELSWQGTTQIRDVATEVRALRERHEQTQTWGSSDLLQTLLAEGLVDVINLWTYPIVLGMGGHVFPAGTVATRFALEEPAMTYPSGVVLLRYRRLDGLPETGRAPGA